jgi:hypothetical protein
MSIKRGATKQRNGMPLNVKAKSAQAAEEKALLGKVGKSHLVKQEGAMLDM